MCLNLLPFIKVFNADPHNGGADVATRNVPVKCLMSKVGCTVLVGVQLTSFEMDRMPFTQHRDQEPALPLQYAWLVRFCWGDMLLVSYSTSCVTEHGLAVSSFEAVVCFSWLYQAGGWLSWLSNRPCCQFTRAGFVRLVRPCATSPVQYSKSQFTHCSISCTFLPNSCNDE